MKSLSPALQAHLDEGTTTLAWCWRISRADGVTFGLTDHDRTLSFDGTEFEPESGLTASEVRSGRARTAGCLSAPRPFTTNAPPMVYRAARGELGVTRPRGRGRMSTRSRLLQR